MRWAEKGLRIWVLVALIGIICIAWRLYRKEGFQIQSVDEVTMNKYIANIASLQSQLDLYKAEQKSTQSSYDRVTEYINRGETRIIGFLNVDEAMRAQVTLQNRLRDQNKRVDDTITEINTNNTELANIKAKIKVISDAAASPDGARTLACSELADLRKHFLLKIAELKGKMNDLSGTEVLGVALKDENMRYQNRYATSCDSLVNSTQGTGLTDVAKKSCIGLASQDDPLYNNVLPAYDTTNTELYTRDLAISDTVNVINDTMTLLNCDVSGIVYNADDDIGTINVEEIKAKLNELSPYYISSGTLDYVTKYLVGNGILDTALYSSTQILREVNNTLTQAKVLSDKIFL